MVNGSNGRDEKGRFAPGNPGGPGNPNVKKTSRLRAALLRAVDEGDFEKAAKALLEKATKGDVIAFRELCDRVLGKAVQSDVLERVERLEDALEELGRG